MHSVNLHVLFKLCLSIFSVCHLHLRWQLSNQYFTGYIEIYLDVIQGKRPAVTGKSNPGRLSL